MRAALFFDLLVSSPAELDAMDADVATQPAPEQNLLGDLKAEPGVPAQPGSRREWPMTSGHGIPSDTARGHLANLEAALRAHRQANGHHDLPQGLGALLVGAEHRARLARESLDKVAGERGELYLAADCPCVLTESGEVTLPCAEHDPE